MLGNLHESPFPAIYGAANIENVSALGVMETYDATSIIVAAVEAAIERAKNAVKDDRMYLDSTVTAHPDAKIREAIL